MGILLARVVGSACAGFMLLLPAAAGGVQKTAQPAQDEAGWVSLFNGKDFGGWKFASPNRKNAWVVCDGVRLNPADSRRFLPVHTDHPAKHRVYMCGANGRGSDIMTEHQFYNYELHVEFTVPKGSNSGIYNRGLYEIQILDSFGRNELGFHDCGSLYERARPKLNVAKAPGEWQTFDIKMAGRNLSLIWNGVEIYKDYDVRYGETDQRAFQRLLRENLRKPPELQVRLTEKDGRYAGFFGNGGTRGSLPGADRAGPILIQGDHGPVAFRNLRIRVLD